MKKSLLFVLSLILCMAYPTQGSAQNQSRTMFVHVKGEKTPLEFDVATIDSISFVESVSRLTFEFKVDNIGMDGADFTIIPSDKNMPYYANYVPTKELKGMSDAEIVESYSQGLDEEYLFKGDFSMTSAETEMSRDTEYTLFAFGYQNGRPNAAGLFKTTFRTLSEKPVVPGPEVKLWGQAGDKDGNNKDTQIEFGMQCTSENASYAECLIVESSEIDTKLSEGFSLEEIVEGNRGSGYVFDNRELALLNGVSFTLSLNSSDGVKPDTKYACLLLVENYDGGQTILREDVKTEVSTEANVKPVVVVEGRAGNASGLNKSTDLTFKLTCTTKNAAYCESFIMETSFIDEIGVPVEDLIAMNEGGGRKMDLEELKQMNGEGALSVWTGNLDNTSYSLLILVKNKMGERTIVRAEAKTEPDAFPFSTQSVNKDVKGKLTPASVKLNAAKRSAKVVSLK